MGKKRIKVMGAEEALKDKKAKKGPPANQREEKRKLAKSGKDRGRLTDMSQVALEEAERIAAKEKVLEEETKRTAFAGVKKEVKKVQKAKKRGQRYLQARAKIDRHQIYSLKEAVKLVKETSIARFNGSIELHLVTQEAGLSGEINFPYPTGKKARIAIADEKLVSQIKKGKIDFDVLLASPEIMPQLASLAKILGPKGLMPNPKKGTITDKPKELAEEMAGKTHFKTEKKDPLIHLVIGKVADPEKNLIANAQAVFKTVGENNLQKAVLTSTMGPGIKIDLKAIS